MGLAIAAIGVPQFFGATFRENLTGLGLITLGLGIAWMTLIAVTIRAERARARQSETARVAVGAYLAAQGVFVGILSSGLILFGALCLLLALGGG